MTDAKNQYELDLPKGLRIWSDGRIVKIIYQIVKRGDKYNVFTTSYNTDGMPTRTVPIEVDDLEDLIDPFKYCDFKPFGEWDKDG